MPAALDNDQQFAALTVLEYLSDLFTTTPHESFSRDAVLSILNRVSNDPELIDPDVLIAYQIATADLPSPRTNPNPFPRIPSWAYNRGMKIKALSALAILFAFAVGANAQGPPDCQFTSTFSAQAPGNAQSEQRRLLCGMATRVLHGERHRRFNPA